MSKWVRFIAGWLLAFGPGPVLAGTFTVVEFNTWGVPLAVKDTFRYAFAMEQLEEISPDFIVLSEVFTARAKRAFHSGQYPYWTDGPKAFPKLVSSGLRILSKHPILRASKIEFCRCKGDDCLSRKGAVLALIQMPDGSKLNLLGTHLNARGGDPIRIDQLEQIRDLIQREADSEAPLVLAGDLNFIPGSQPYSWLGTELSLSDSWAQTHPASEPGYTYDAFENAYARDYAIRTHFPLTRERIDYILYRNGNTASLRAESSRLILNERPWYSDHYGLSTTFTTQ
jgi:endonuclease/exonuclease/phosphatase family metal-dependent hydrolase